jgi:ABC-type tungstate transport system permease subunit
LTHAPSSEAQFVQDGFSPVSGGRSSGNDYVFIGHDADPGSTSSAPTRTTRSAPEAIAGRRGGNATGSPRR